MLATATLHANEGRRLSAEDREAMKEKAKAHVMEILDQSDENADDYFSEDELIGALTALREHREEMRERTRQILEDSGRELPERAKGERRDPPAPEDIAARIIERLDDDGDALVSRAEAESALERFAKRGRGGPEGRKRGERRDS